MDIIVDINHLDKFYRTSLTWGKIIKFNWKTEKIHALKNISLRLYKGQISGIGGPNGSGKSSLLKIISGLLLPTCGSCRVFGYDVCSMSEQIKKLIGVSYSDARSFFYRLGGRNNLRFFGSLQGLSGRELENRVEESLSLMKLNDVADRVVFSYSDGMKQRLSIARALMHRPQLLIFDEITKGLDPGFQTTIHRLLKEELAGKYGMTILLATHNIFELRTLCDEVVLLKEGSIAASGRYDDIRNRLEYVFGEVCDG
jgi:ABC-2 type transport system ATP-binding protein